VFYKLIWIAFMMIGSSALAQSIDLDKYVDDFKRIDTKEQMPELLVFASFSLPTESLKQLATQVSKAEGVLVFRGMHEGSMKKTISLLHTLNQQGVPVIIHPKLFTEHKVGHVPTFVFKSTDRMVGNVPLGYALRTFAKDGDNKEIAKRYLKKLEDNS
jgi:conjugal transfer pilus assembly protein TrbC